MSRHGAQYRTDPDGGQERAHPCPRGLDSDRDRGAAAVHRLPGRSGYHARRAPFDREPRYRVVVGDHFWHWLYLPVADLVERLSRWIGRLQQGRIAVYLLYSFLTLVAVLVLVKR